MRVGTIEFLIEGADENEAPEMIDRSRSLSFLTQPVEHRGAVSDLRSSATCDYAKHCARDRIFVPESEKRKTREGRSQMQRRRQPRGFDPTAMPLRIREDQLVVIMNLVGDDGSSKEVF